MPHTAGVGQLGEQLVRDHLTRRGFTIISSHYLTREGEIDIIAKKHERWHFVEVKTRRRLISSVGELSETVSTIKQVRLEKAMYAYLQEHPEIQDYRLDVALVHLKKTGARIIYHPNALEAHHDI